MLDGDCDENPPLREGIERRGAAAAQHASKSMERWYPRLDLGKRRGLQPCGAHRCLPADAHPRLESEARHPSLLRQRRVLCNEVAWVAWERMGRGDEAIMEGDVERGAMGERWKRETRAARWGKRRAGSATRLLPTCESSKPTTAMTDEYTASWMFLSHKDGFDAPLSILSKYTPAQAFGPRSVISEPRAAGEHMHMDACAG